MPSIYHLAKTSNVRYNQSMEPTTEIEEQNVAAARAIINEPVKPSEIIEQLAGPFGKVVVIQEVADEPV